MSADKNMMSQSQSKLQPVQVSQPLPSVNQQTGQPVVPQAGRQTDQRGQSDGHSVPMTVQQRLAHLAGQEPWDGTDPLASLSDLQASFDLANAHPTGVARLLASGQVTLANLFHEQADLTANERSLAHLAQQASTDQLRYGFGQIQLAVGIATWSQGRYEMPIVLFPIHLGHDDGRRLTRTPLFVEQSPFLNPRLIALLRSRSIVLNASQLLVQARGKDGSFDTLSLLGKIEAAARRHIADFTIERRYVFGCFINPASVLARRARDIASATTSQPLLDQSGEPDWQTVAGRYRHTLPVLALGGDHHALSTLRGQDAISHDTSDPDPHDEQEVGDVSATVRRAAQAAADGTSFFLDTPTGLESVPYTLAIATRAAGQGRRVLVVPDGPRQKNEFVRLAARAGVSPLILDMSDQQAGAHVDQQFVDSLSPETSQSTAVTDFNTTADELVGVRSRLSYYFDSLHEPIRPWNVSVYESIEQLAGVSALPSKPRTRVRLSDQCAKTLRDRLDTTGNTLVRLGELGEYTLQPADTPWYGAKLYSRNEADDAQQRVQRLLQTTLPSVREQLSRTVKTCGFVVAQTVDQWGSQIAVLQSLRRVLDLFRPEIFDQDLDTALAATLNRQQRAEAGVHMGFWARRRAIKDVRHCLHPGQKPDDLHATLEVVQQQAKRWREFVPSGGWPVLPDGLDEIISTYDQMNNDLTALDAVLVTPAGTKPLVDSTFVDVEARLRALYADQKSLETLPERMRLDRQLRNEGLGELLDDLIARHVSAKTAPDELRLSWWTTVFEAIVHSSRLIADQDASVLSDAVTRFQQVDRRHVATIGPLLMKQVRHHLAETLYKNRREANQLHDILRREAHVSPARLLREWPTLTWAAKPIVIASVADLAMQPLGGRPADLVIVAGAGHMPSAEVLICLESADSCVIAAHKSTVTGEALARLADVLPTVEADHVLADMPTALSAFLTRRGQKVELIPSAGTSARTVNLVRVRARGIPSSMSGLVESSSTEVDAVTQAVINAALERSKSAALPSAASTASSVSSSAVSSGVSSAVTTVRPLTVFTLSEYNARLIQRSLVEAARKSSDLRNFLPHVLVTPVSRCSGAPLGDVIISLGFAPTIHGVLLQQFGLIDQPGGDRLLLDALLRTSGSLTIVSAFASSDMQDDRLHEAGPRLLKMLLRWAESIGVTGEQTSSHSDHEGVLMRDLATRLRARGALAAVGYGFTNGVCLPLAVGTKTHGYRWAVLTDNEQFMSSKSLRYRFRLLPRALERRGWTVMSAWSVGTFINPDSVVEAIVSKMGPSLDEDHENHADQSSTIASTGEQAPLSDLLSDTAHSTEKSTRSSKES